MKDPKDNDTIEMVGLTPRGSTMPQTLAEWKRLAEVYGAALERERLINSQLRSSVNDMRQKITYYRSDAYLELQS